MTHPNKNMLITFYYQEGTAREQKKVSSHVNLCNECQGYLQTLDEVGSKLAQLPDELPSARTFEATLAEISIKKLKTVQQPQLFLLKPILKIAFSLIFILSVLFIIQSKISSLPIWQSISQYWITQTIGSFGVVIILFFCICTFITLSLAPILIMEMKKKNELHFQSGVHLLSTKN